MSDEQDTLEARLVIRDFDGDIEIRQVGLGAQAIVLIEPVEENDEVHFAIDATGLDQSELADLFETLAEILRKGEEKV